MPGKQSVVFSVSLLFVQILLLNLDTTAAASAILVLISESRDMLLGMVEPRYVKLSTTSRVASSMLTEYLHPDPRRLFS